MRLGTSKEHTSIPVSSTGQALTFPLTRGKGTERPSSKGMDREESESGVLSPHEGRGLRREVLGQRGFTLIELMIAMAISMVILVVIGWSIFQVFQMNTRNTNHMTAVREVQSAGYWFSHDAAQAPYDPATPPWISTNGATLYLKWRDAVNYTSENDTSTIAWDSVSGKITRSYDGGTAAPIAEHISNANFSLNLDADNNVSKVIMVVTSTVTSHGLTSTETRTYEASPRPGQAQ